jgi:hypothetical protein
MHTCINDYPIDIASARGGANRWRAATVCVNDYPLVGAKMAASNNNFKFKKFYTIVMLKKGKHICGGSPTIPSFENLSSFEIKLSTIYGTFAEFF